MFRMPVELLFQVLDHRHPLEQFLMVKATLLVPTAPIASQVDGRPVVMILASFLLLF